MGGVNVVTNDKKTLRESLERIGYECVNVIEILFTLDVPRDIPFYSAHFKIDVYRYFAQRPDNEYSILVDGDVVCMREFCEEFYSITDEGLPMVYYLDGYGGSQKMRDVKKIVSDVSWMPWTGGEFIGGKNDFFAMLYDAIMKFKDAYWKVVNDGLFHVGDEMLTSIAVQRLRRKAVCPVDAKVFSVVHRYWSIHEHKSLSDYHVSLMHLPGDKVFFKGVDLDSNNISQLLKGYNTYTFIQRIKGVIHRILR